MIKALLSAVIIFSYTVSDCIAQQKNWAERIAQTVMVTHPDSIVVKKYVPHQQANDKTLEEIKRAATWDYEQGVLLKGFDALWKTTGNRIYYDYMKKIIDKFIGEDGTIRTYDLTEYNIDEVAPGIILLSLYKETKQDKYKKASYLLREQLRWQPRTKQGGFWHKHKYPYQMWLDGLYMGEPFYAEFANLFNEPEDFDDITNQFIWMEQHARDPKTGLLYHAWDESMKQRWSNSLTGQSSQFWSRGMGWYAMALVDVLDYIPEDHSKRNELIAILQRLTQALKTYQDSQTGVWFQVTDKATAKGNYPEASSTCMFVYTIAKGVRKGYLDRELVSTATKGFNGIIKSFIETDSKGIVHLMNSCGGAGLGGTPYRDGSYAYYIKEPTRKDDLKGIGPFIQASIEIELLNKSK